MRNFEEIENISLDKVKKSIFFSYEKEHDSKHVLQRSVKDHHSICGPFIFPIQSVDQIVPPSLHILLGITLVGYNMLNEDCKAIDAISHRQERSDIEEG